jgi:DNA-binding CsgD family transcriptional regulator
MAVDSPTTALTGRRAECAVLDRLLESVRIGQSQTLVVRGDAGVGKTALLEYLVEHASGCRVLRAVGVQSEMELAFAGLYQLLAPVFGRIERLLVPQRDALRTAFGASPGPAPDRFLVGLAALGLLSDVAEAEPLICVVDDAQWLDQASAQTLAFVARRLEAESVGLVFAARTPSGDLAGLPDLLVEGLSESDALALLDALLTGPLDVRVRDQIVSETRGNPLALLELSRAMTPAELAGGFGLPGWEHSGRIEESFRRRLDALPSETRRLLQLAAADPVGDPVLLWRAAERLGIAMEAATPAVEDGLIEFAAWVRFLHPVVRSVAYRSASLQERRDVHRALAEVTDPDIDPDRRAWHRAHAAAGPDEEVASELERSASRAQARGGLAASAAFLERAAMLTLQPGRRAERLIAAARAKRDTGALDAALGLLVAVEARPLDARRTAEVERLRGQIALVQRRGGDAAQLLLSAARRFQPLDAELARETHLEALGAAMWAADLTGPSGVLEAAKAALAAPPGHDEPRAVDVQLDAFATRWTDGYAAAAPGLTRALGLLLALSADSDEVGVWLAGGSTGAVALELWDAESAHALGARVAQFARDTGALVHLQFALNILARTHLLAGEFATAALMIEEDRLIAEVTGNPPVGYSEMSLVAWRGEEAHWSELIDASLQDSRAGGLGAMANFADCASSVLYNGLGRHDAARDAAQRAFEHDQLGLGPFVVPELAEAASRTGDVALVQATLDWLSERTRATPAEWALGIEARIRAFLSDGALAEGLYRESMQRLGRTRVRVEVARGRLLYGEWLRRRNRRVDAREQLRTAHEMFGSMGARAFAERARRELVATGETVRKRTNETRDELTAQEALIARLARDGLSNPEIGTRLFISPQTVKYHLRKVFIKLGVGSRNELDRVLPSDQPAGTTPH